MKSFNLPLIYFLTDLEMLPLLVFLPICFPTYFGLKIFFLYMQFKIFETKTLQSPGTCISKRTWDPSQKTITK